MRWGVSCILFLSVCFTGLILAGALEDPVEDVVLGANGTDDFEELPPPYEEPDEGLLDLLAPPGPDEEALAADEEPPAASGPNEEPPPASGPNEEPAAAPCAGLS